MTILEFSPRDPLIVRDGRPNDGRSQSRSLGFPPPSVTAGVVRTALGRRDGAFDTRLIESLLEHVSLRGPLLADEVGLLVPAPRDAVIMTLPDGDLRMRALAPIELPSGAATSHGGTLIGLLPGEIDKGKPRKDVPSLWTFASLARWLEDPGTRDDAGTRELLRGGATGLVREERLHVAVGPSFTAEEGKLFDTEGLRAWARRWDERADAQRERDGKARIEPKLDGEVWFELDVQVGSAELDAAVLPGLRPMGGERRLACWRSVARAWPEVPSWLLDRVGEGDSVVVRVVLLTPAYVEASLKPLCLHGPGVEVVAAKVDRPETISGWDLSLGRGGAPKRTRRLASAGSVYWVQLRGAAAERQRWAADTWMSCIGDDEQLRRDGFGLAVVGLGRHS